MKIVKGYPPNYQYIQSYLTPTPTAVFCYGEMIFNPSGVSLAPDIEYHEQIHARQQKDSQPELWWTKYCLDKDFRLRQEVEAYAGQWLFVKKHIPKATKEALESFAEILASPMYNLGITKWQAETEIRLKAKTL